MIWAKAIGYSIFAAAWIVIIVGARASRRDWKEMRDESGSREVGCWMLRKERD